MEAIKVMMACVALALDLVALKDIPIDILIF